MRRIAILFLVLLTSLGLSNRSFASHLYGGDLKYEYVSSAGNNHTYKVTLVIYGDCSTGPTGVFGTLPLSQPGIFIYKNGVVYNPSPGINLLTLPIVPAQSDIEITPVCPDEVNNTACSSPQGTLPGIKKYTFAQNVVLDGAANWSFVFGGLLVTSTAGRSNLIQNLQAVGITGLIATLKNTNGQNSSPNFTASPTPFFCVAKENTYTLGAVDPDNDGLVFSITPALNGNGTNFPPAVQTLPEVAYNVPFTAAQPFPFAPGSFSFNTTSGQMGFTPANPGGQPTYRSIVANKVFEIRSGDTVGTSMREMTFVFLNDCDNSQPVDSTGDPTNANIIVDNGEQLFQTCEGQTGNVSFPIAAHDPDGDNITVTWNNLPAGALGSVQNNGTPNPTFLFDWNIASTVGAGDYTFYLTFTDDGCPLSVTKTVAKTLRILPFQGGLLTGSRSHCIGQTNGYAWLTQIPTDLDDYNIVWTNNFGDTLQTAYGHNGDTLFNLGTGIYHVIAINANGCSKYLDISILPPIYDAIITVSDSMACVNEPFTFTNSSVGDLSQFSWNFGDGTTSNAANPVHAYTHSGTYTVKLVGVSSLGCADSATVQVTVDTVYVPTFTIDKDTLCMGGKIMFYPDAGPNSTNLSWDFGGSWQNTADVDSVVYTWDHAGEFPVTLNVSYRNCPEASFTRTIHIFPYPVVSLGPDSVMCLKGEAIVLQNLASNPAGTYQNKWSSGETTPTLTVTEPGTYRLTVSSVYECSTTEEMVINKDCYVDIPNSFTPNGDGINDYFFPRQLLSKGVKGFSMQVFNRWGQIVFQTEQPDGRGWDGRFNEKEQPAGVYIYVIKGVLLKNGRLEQYTGNVTLLR
jgi:gliding motility-associated-like protein